MSAAPSEDPEMVINETDAPGDTRGEVKIDPSLRGGTTGGSADVRQGDQADARAEKGPAPYAHVGAVFADWFNDKVRQLVNPTIDLGTKKGSVVRLHPDGRLECNLHSEGGDSQTFVAFEAPYLDQLVRKIAAIGL